MYVTFNCQGSHPKKIKKKTSQIEGINYKKKQIQTFNFVILLDVVSSVK